MMPLIPLYLRREPTTDCVTLKHDRHAAKRMDVVAYRDADHTKVACRWPWYYTSKPRRGCQRVTMNCYRWKAVWQ